MRSNSDSPGAGNLAIQSNNGTIYVTSQHPNATESINGLRYAAASEVRFEDENYANARYEYQHGQHHPNGPGDDIKIELIRNHNQHGLHGKVNWIYFHNF